MRQHFVRVYIGIAVVLLLGATATLFMINREFASLRRRAMAERLIGQASMMRQLLANTENPELRLRQLSTSDMHRTVGIEQPDALGLLDADLARIRAGETIAVYQDDWPTAYCALSNGNVLVLSIPRRNDSLFSSGFLNPPDLVLLGLLILVLLLIGTAIYVLIRPLERRIYSLAAVAERFGQGDLESRARVDREDAIAELAGTFNAMAERVKGLVDRQRELLRAVSHEFRTPLARLFFVLDEAQEAETSDEKDVHLLRIQRSLNELNDLVEELLTYARLERGAAEPVLEPLNVYALMWEMPDVVMELRDDVTVEVDCEQITIRAMPRNVKRALQNLVTNAVRHARTGIWLSGHVEGAVLHIAVEDDGPGIPEAHREKIFEPFARLDESRNAKLGGTGLGLAIVKRIMELHEGTVTVDDSPHGGARFTLSFSVHGERSLVDIRL